MKKREYIFLSIACLFLVMISKTSNSNGYYECMNPLEYEYSALSVNLPSFGFSGGAFRIHSQSAYVSGFWGRVSMCQNSYGGWVNEGYRCPWYNLYGITPAGKRGSRHMYGNAADINGASSMMYMNYQSLGNFLYTYQMSETAFHIDDLLY